MLLASAQAASDREPAPKETMPSMVYFNNDTGIVLDEDQAEIKFGMTLNKVRKALKGPARLTSEKGVKSLIFEFECNSDYCTIDDGSNVFFNFVQDTLIGIMLMTNTEVGAEKYASFPIKIHGGAPDYKCTRKEGPLAVTSYGWKGDIKTALTIFQMTDKSGGGAVTLEFRTDKFRMNFRKSICTPN